MRSFGSTFFRNVTLALPLSAAFFLASCNNANVPSGSALASIQPTREADLRRQQREVQREVALKKLSERLNSQKAELEKADAVSTAAVRPELVEKSNTPIVAALVPTPADNQVIAALPKVEKVSASGPLGRFHAKLAALKNGQRKKPVTILHIGDSHVASDSFSRGIRTELQKQFGNAGRGMVIPAKAYKYGVADQITLKAAGSWRSATALRAKRRGRFGISGVNVRSRSSRASMTLTSNVGKFDWAEVTVATGPSQGAFKLRVGRESKTFEAYSKRKGSKAFRINARGKKVTLVPGGGAQTTVLNWATGKDRPGVRYINFGLNGATVDITKKFDMKLVDNDVRHLDPDLIVYGYGTNEGFNDRLDTKAYALRAKKYVKRLKANAPNADVVFLGAASGLRRKGNRACGGWSTPPKLGPLRKTVRTIAAEQKAGFWDWSQAMGGVCAINAWAGKGLASKDRVHLTMKGYRASAGKFVDWLTTPRRSNTLVALN